MTPMLLLFLSSASTKNPVQKRTKEKFPIDVVTSSQPEMDHKEQVPEMKMDVPPPQSAHTEALPPPSAETENFTPGLGSRGQRDPPLVAMKSNWVPVGKQNLDLANSREVLSVCVAVPQPLEPPPAKSVKISAEDPVVIPDPR